MGQRTSGVLDWAPEAVNHLCSRHISYWTFSHVSLPRCLSLPAGSIPYGPGAFTSSQASQELLQPCPPHQLKPSVCCPTPQLVGILKASFSSVASFWLSVHCTKSSTQKGLKRNSWDGTSSFWCSRLFVVWCEAGVGAAGKIKPQDFSWE